jgi:hypothetical protein
MTRSCLSVDPTSHAVTMAATLLVSVVSCGGGDFTIAVDDAGVDSSSSGGSGSSSSASSGSSSGSGGGSSSGASGGGASSGGSGGDSGVCPAGQRWCAACDGIHGSCAQTCPAIACAGDAAGAPDGTVEGGGPPDARAHDSSVCPTGEQLCPVCGTGQPYCAQVCPAILCVPLDAASDAFQSGTCNPPCGPSQMCCPGGTPNSFFCQTAFDGGRCLPVP